MDEAELEAALVASALEHFHISTEWAVDKTYELDRAEVLLPTCIHSPRPGLLRQIGTVNQFHDDWAPLKGAHRTSSAICGYTAVAIVNAAAEWPPLSCEADLAALRAYLLDADRLRTDVSDAMARVHASRKAWIDTHLATFLGEGSQRAYERAWVANYEISDVLRGVSPAGSDIAFVRFNQYPERGAASEEELERLTKEEAQFGGGVGSKSAAETFAPGDSMFIVELFGRQGHASELGGAYSPPCMLRPDAAFVHVAETGRGLKAAVLDLDGHFVAAVPLRPPAAAAGEVGGSCCLPVPAVVLLNTTGHNYLAPGSAGALAAALAFDLFFGPAEAYSPPLSHH